MRIVKRAVGVLLVVVLVAILAVTGLLVWVTARAFPQTSGTATIPGSRANVTVVRDATGIAHITADTTHDLFVAQGYVHASERMWQMEVWRHISAGRLAEMFGASQLDTDKFIRTLGWRVAAQRDLDAVAPEARAVLDAYTEGVNAWLDGHRGSLGLAFLAAGVTPEPWTDLDTLAWGKVQAWNLGGNFDSEVFRYLADAQLGDPARTDELFPAYREDAPVITPTGLPGSGGAGAHGPAGRQCRATASASPTHSPSDRPGRSGRLALDRRSRPGPPADRRARRRRRPRLGPRDRLERLGRRARGCRRPAAPSSPTIRTWASRCPRSGSSTASIAGPSPTPARMTSRASRSLACPASSWGTTRASRGARPTSIPTSRTSSSRQVDPADPNAYMHDGTSTPFDVRHEQIKVAGKEPFDLEIRSTVHGPILNDVDERLKDAPPMAIRWTANLEPDRTFEAILGLDTAASFQDFRESLSLYGAPAQNFVYADVDGHIGYQFPGYVPIRSNPDDRGDRPVRGDDGSGEWTGRIPFDDLPWQFDPEDGVIVTANNAAVDANYPHFVAQEWDPGFRAERILDQIGLYGADGLTVDEMRRIQYDDSPLAPRDMIPLLEEATPTTDDGATIATRIGDWDGACDRSSLGCAA